VIRITCSDARFSTQPLRIWRKITFEQAQAALRALSIGLLPFFSSTG
jgi:hypothetical protein